MWTLFRLIRLPNLLIVALTQYLLYYRVLVPGLEIAGLYRTLNDTELVTFILITVLITAGGYIINDLLDFPTDLINKPDKVLIERRIRTSTAYWLYFSFNLLGYILALYLAFIVRYLPYLFLFPLAVIGLYLYSHFLKRRALWGNLLIALYCAAVAAVLLLTEQGSLQALYDTRERTLYPLGALFLWYLVFAFFATMYRELIKDLEDEPGDRKQGMRTAPVAWGLSTAKTVAFIIGLWLLLFIGLWSAFFYPAFTTFTWGLLLAGVSAPLAYTLVRIRTAHTPRDFHHLSQVTKWLMLGGILILLSF